jgi:hypothetical protein
VSDIIYGEEVSMPGGGNDNISPTIVCFRISLHSPPKVPDEDPKTLALPVPRYGRQPKVGALFALG